MNLLPRHTHLLRPDNMLTESMAAMGFTAFDSATVGEKILSANAGSLGLGHNS